MVHGGTLVIADTAGSGKTFVGQRILQDMLDYYPRGAIRLFIIDVATKCHLTLWAQSFSATFSCAGFGLRLCYLDQA